MGLHILCKNVTDMKLKAQWHTGIMNELRRNKKSPVTTCKF